MEEKSPSFRFSSAWWPGGMNSCHGAAPRPLAMARTLRCAESCHCYCYVVDDHDVASWLTHSLKPPTDTVSSPSAQYSLILVVVHIGCLESVRPRILGGVSISTAHCPTGCRTILQWTSNMGGLSVTHPVGQSVVLIETGPLIRFLCT